MPPATFFLLLQLLLLTNGSLAAPVDDICRKTKDPPRCVSILKGTDERTPTATLPVLEEVAIEATMYTAGQAKIKVQDLATFSKDPNLKGIYRNCENLYRDALDELNFAQGNLEKGRIGKLLKAAGLVERAVNGCAAAARTNAELKKDTDDTAVVGQAIGIIARNLP